ncbi:ATP12 family chaperone protein [Alsobacter sp. R-9]
MADDLTDLFFHDGPRPVDPRAAARASVQAPLPRRFYREAGVAATDGGHGLVLDGRPARTPGKAPLAVPSLAVAEAIAREWESQAEVIDPTTMPLTRLVNSALDGVAQRLDDVAAEIARYGGSDLLCYRAGEPARLVQRQTDVWDPLVDWAHEALGARLILAEGVMFAEQPPGATAAITAAVERFRDPLALAALSTMTSLTGSVVLALAVAHGRLSAQEAWAAAHLDEDFQMEVWGEDEEALQRRAARWREMEAAAFVVGAAR